MSELTEGQIEINDRISEIQKILKQVSQQTNKKKLVEGGIVICHCLYFVYAKSQNFISVFRFFVFCVFFVCLHCIHKNKKSNNNCLKSLINGCKLMSSNLTLTDTVNPSFAAFVWPELSCFDILFFLCIHVCWSVNVVPKSCMEKQSKHTFVQLAFCWL